MPPRTATRAVRAPMEPIPETADCRPVAAPASSAAPSTAACSAWPAPLPGRRRRPSAPPPAARAPPPRPPRAAGAMIFAGAEPRASSASSWLDADATATALWASAPSPGIATAKATGLWVIAPSSLSASGQGSGRLDSRRAALRPPLRRRPSAQMPSQDSRQSQTPPAARMTSSWAAAKSGPASARNRCQSCGARGARGPANQRTPAGGGCPRRGSRAGLRVVHRAPPSVLDAGRRRSRQALPTC